MDHLPAEVLERIRNVRLFLTDVDGVLTDATVYVSQESESKKFNIRDGLGLRLLQSCGIKVGWVSARFSTATEKRAAELKIDFLSQKKDGKVLAVETILADQSFTWADVCYVGDDVVDLGVLRRAGFSAAPADAIEEVRQLAHYVCRARGGEGAVRELVELILKSQGRWNKIIDEFSA